MNVSRSSTFYDLKFIEMRREREAMEMAKRQSGERVEEFRKVIYILLKESLICMHIATC